MATGSPHTHRRRVRWLPRAPTTGQGGFEGHGGRVVPPRPSRTHSTVSEQVRDAPGWRGGPTPRLCTGRTGCGAQAGELLRARSPATGPVPLWRRTPRPSSCWTWPAVKTWAGVPASATCRARLEYRRASQRLPPQPSRCKGASGSVAPSPHPIRDFANVLEFHFLGRFALLEMTILASPAILNGRPEWRHFWVVLHFRLMPRAVRETFTQVRDQGRCRF